MNPILPGPAKRRLTGIATLAWALFFIVCLGGLGSAGIYLYLSPKLPDVESLRSIQLQIPMRVYSADGKLIGEFGEMRRTPLPIGDTPSLLVRAVIAAEDNRFFEHHGVDIKGLLRATTELATSGQIRTGGSTITMQVAKNFFLSADRTFSRKFSEILLALRIEDELTKTEILELYLNKIYLGNRAYGAQAAAQIYYGKDVRELSLAQWAMIAGLPKAPSTFNPLANPERAMIRRNWILQRMLELGYIDQAAYATATAEPNTAEYHGTLLDQDAPYVAEMARQEVISRYGLQAYTAGLVVRTTVDSHLQAVAQQAVRRGLIEYDWRHGYRGPEGHWPGAGDGAVDAWLEKLGALPETGGLVPAVVTVVGEQSLSVLTASHGAITLGWEQGLSTARRYETINRRGPAPVRATDIAVPGDVVRLWRDERGQWQLRQVPKAQAALVSLDPHDGAILALSGGFDFRQSKFNRATQAARQPGSNFKPFIYSAALEHGFTAASIINDAPLVFDDQQLEDSWRPENSSGRFNGPTTLREALINSRNLVSIRLLKDLGIPVAVEYASRFGFDSQRLPRDLSLALGTHAVPPMDIARAYAVLANGGYRVQPYLIRRIEDSNGDVRFEANPDTVCDPCDETPASAAPAEADTLETLLQENPSPPPAIHHPAAPRVMDARAAYIMNSILQDVVRKGTARKALALRRNDIAGKTGTTNGPTDAWFSGYNPDVVTTVWLGFDQNQVLGQNEYGGTAALPIWMEFMGAALQGKPEVPRAQPPGLVTVRIDPTTGKRARPGQAGAVFEVFQEELAPPEEAGSEGGGQPAENPGNSAAQPWELF